MPNEQAREVTARSKQSAASKRATLDQLKSKKSSTIEFSVYLSGEDGEKNEVTLLYKAIGATAYDKLIAKHPPKPEQRAEGASFNIDTFAPALIAASSVDPEISMGDAKELWESPDWSRGDVMVLFRTAVELNNRGIDIPFSENG